MQIVKGTTVDQITGVWEYENFIKCLIQDFDVLW